MADDRALAVAAGGECAQDVYRRGCSDGKLAVAVAKILEARLIHDFRAENLGVADLQGVFGGFRVVGLGRKVELADSVVVLSIAKILVARRKRVVLADLVIETRAKVGAGPWIRNRVGK